MAWQSVIDLRAPKDLPNNQTYQALNISKSEGRLIVSLPDKILIFNESLKLEETIPVDITRNFQRYRWVPSPTNRYAGWFRSHGTLFRVGNIKDVSTWFDTGVNPAWDLITSNDSAIGLEKRGFAGVWVKSDNSKHEFNFNSHPALADLHSSKEDSFVLFGDSVFIGTIDGIQETSNRTGNQLKPFNGVLEVNLVTKEIKDLTYLIRATNATGTDQTATGCAIDVDQVNGLIYCCTQTAVNAKRLGATEWTQIKEAWLGSSVDLLENGEIFITSKDGSLVLKDHDYFPQQRLPKNFIHHKAIVLGDNIVAYGKTPFPDEQPLIVFSKKRIEKRPEIKTIEYLNLVSPVVDATVHKDVAYLATVSGICNATGKRISTTPALALAINGNEIIAASSTDLFIHDLGVGADRTIAKFAKPIGAAAIAVGGKHISVIQSVLDEKDKTKTTGTKVSVYDLSGKLVFEFSETGTILTDALFDGEEYHLLGFLNRNNVLPVQMGFHRVYRTSDFKMRDRDPIGWNFNPKDMSANMADFRPYKIFKYGGELIVAAESAGGNSIGRYKKDKKTSVVVEGQDWYSDAVQTADPHITYICAIDPATLEIKRGQFTLTRTPSMKGNTLRVHSLFVANDKIYIGGLAADAIYDRTSCKVLGKSVSKYDKGDGSLLTLPLSLDGTRVDWITPGTCQRVRFFNGATAIASVDNTGDIPFNVGNRNKALTHNTVVINF